MRIATAWRPFFWAAMMFVAGGLPPLQAEIPVEASDDKLVLAAISEIKAEGNGHFVTTASINRRDVRVMVDTGASAVALSYEDAETIGLRPGFLDYDVEVSTANGITKAAQVTLDEVEIDTVRVSNVKALVLPSGAMRGSLLGMSFLSRLSTFRVEDGVLILKN